MARRGCGALAGRRASPRRPPRRGREAQGAAASRGCVRGAGRGAGACVAGFLRAVRRPPAFVRQRRRRRRRGEPVREAEGAGPERTVTWARPGDSEAGEELSGGWRSCGGCVTTCPTALPAPRGGLKMPSASDGIRGNLAGTRPVGTGRGHKCHSFCWRGGRVPENPP